MKGFIYFSSEFFLSDLLVISVPFFTFALYAYPWATVATSPSIYIYPMLRLTGAAMKLSLWIL